MQLNDEQKEYLDSISQIKEISYACKRSIELHYEIYGADGMILEALKILSNCREIYDNGIHRMQTNNFTYKFTFYEIKYAFENYNVSLNPNEIIDICKREHEANLKFEIEFPPVDYNLINKFGKQKHKNNNLKKEPKPKKEKVSSPKIPFSQIVLDFSKLNIK